MSVGFSGYHSDEDWNIGIREIERKMRSPLGDLSHRSPLRLDGLAKFRFREAS